MTMGFHRTFVPLAPAAVRRPLRQTLRLDDISDKFVYTFSIRRYGRYPRKPPMGSLVFSGV